MCVDDTRRPRACLGRVDPAAGRFAGAEEVLGFGLGVVARFTGMVRSGSQYAMMRGGNTMLYAALRLDSQMFECQMHDSQDACLYRRVQHEACQSIRRLTNQSSIV